MNAIYAFARAALVIFSRWDTSRDPEQSQIIEVAQPSNAILYSVSIFLIFILYYTRLSM